VETFTCLFTDIEGSTALVRRLGEGLYAQVLADHHALIRSALAAHDGREVDTQGDAFFAEFSSARAGDSRLMAASGTSDLAASTRPRFGTAIRLVRISAGWCGGNEAALIG
jgi:class 3 adenylate cyclase